MLATRYDEADVTKEQWRVLDRIGARDPAGIKLAMKRHGVDDIESLVALLEHHKPQRRVKQRIMNSIARFTEGTKRDPHAEEIKRAFKLHFENQEHIKVKERIRRTKSNYEG